MTLAEFEPLVAMRLEALPDGMFRAHFSYTADGQEYTATSYPAHKGEPEGRWKLPAIYALYLAQTKDAPG